MLKSFGQTRTYIITCVTAGLFLVGLFVAQYQFSVLHPGGNDSLPRWIGTKYWAEYGISPYSQRVSDDAQIMTTGHVASASEDQQYFVYPFYAVLFYLPIIWLPYETGRALGMLGIELALAGAVLLSARAFQWSPPKWLSALTVVWALLFYNGLRTIILWQLAGIVVGLVAVSIWALKGKRDILAGICLALATVKPQMIIVIVPLLMFWAFHNRRWKLMTAFGGSMLVLFGFSFLFVPGWMGDMLAQIGAYENYTDIGSLIGVFVSALPGFLAFPVKWFLIAICVIWLAWEWWQVRHSEAAGMDWVLAFTLVMTTIVVDRTATTNQLIMLPAVVYIFASMQRGLGGRSFLWVVVIEMAYLMATWVLFALTFVTIRESWAVYVPMPALMLIGMILTRPGAKTMRLDRTGVSSPV